MIYMQGSAIQGLNTSMSVDVSRKAELAVNMLMRLIDGEEVRESEPKIDAVIAERESVMKVEEGLDY